MEKYFPLPSTLCVMKDLCSEIDCDASQLPVSQDKSEKILKKRVRPQGLPGIFSGYLR